MRVVPGVLDFGRKEFWSMAKEGLFRIVCPCNCGRAITVEFHPPQEKPLHLIQSLEKSEIKILANLIWQRVVEARGLEGAIQFLHERADA